MRDCDKTDEQLIAEYIALNGVKRYPPGASSDTNSLSISEYHKRQKARMRGTRNSDIAQTMRLKNRSA